MKLFFPPFPLRACAHCKHSRLRVTPPDQPGAQAWWCHSPRVNRTAEYIDANEARKDNAKCGPEAIHMEFRE